MCSPYDALGVTHDMMSWRLHLDRQSFPSELGTIACSGFSPSFLRCTSHDYWLANKRLAAEQPLKPKLVSVVICVFLHNLVQFLRLFHFPIWSDFVADVLDPWRVFLLEKSLCAIDWPAESGVVYNLGSHKSRNVWIGRLETTIFGVMSETIHTLFQAQNV